jgi:hypothetical protein
MAEEGNFHQQHCQNIKLRAHACFHRAQTVIHQILTQSECKVPVHLFKKGAALCWKLLSPMRALLFQHYWNRKCRTFIATFTNLHSTSERRTGTFPPPCITLTATLQSRWSAKDAIKNVHNHPERLLVCFWRDRPQWARASSFTKFIDHTERRTTVGRTPLNEW